MENNYEIVVACGMIREILRDIDADILLKGGASLRSEVIQKKLYHADQLVEMIIIKINEKIDNDKNDCK
jgi:hypothetical protein